MFEKQNQSSGDNSQNLQAGGDIILHGLSYTETKILVKEEAQKVFKDNSLALAEEAYKIIISRSEELLDNFLKKLEERTPEAINSMQDPSMQYSLFNAQKEYAKTGDKDLASLLEDILVERAQLPKRDLLQIVLDECISIAPKLTTDQFDTLSLIFILKYTTYNAMFNFTDLISYIESHLMPFADGLVNNNSRFQHLEFAGCGSLSTTTQSIEEIFLQKYLGLFSNGFTREEFEKYAGTGEHLKTFMVPCLHNPSKFQVLSASEVVLKHLMKANNVSEIESANIISLCKRNLMSKDEVRGFLIELFPPFKQFIDQWNESPIKSMTLTSVGIAIAHTNINQNARLAYDLKTWIN